MKIAVGADHAGYLLKDQLKIVLSENGHDVLDCGTEGPESVDYPDFAHAVAKTLESGDAEMGLLVCGTGLGMSMAANRHHHVRAAVCRGIYEAQMAREHNNANVLCLGARVTGDAVAEASTLAFFSTEFAGGRHEKRIAKIEAD